MSPHRLASPRLDLEPLEARHADAIAAQYLDERIWTYFPRLRPPDVAALRAQFTRWSEGPPADVAEVEGWENWVGLDRERAEPIGTFQATIIQGEPANLAYAVFPAYWRHGYATEAMRAVMKHLADDHGVTRVVAEMDARNTASIGVAQALGLREVARRAVDDARTGARGVELRYEGVISAGTPGRRTARRGKSTRPS